MQSKLNRFVGSFDLHTYTGQVDFLYCQYQQAVNDDNILLDYYRKHIGSTIGKEDTIKRVGRALRAKNKGRDGKYRRDPEFQLASELAADAAAKHWRKK